MLDRLWQFYSPQLTEVLRVAVLTSVFWLPVLLAFVAARLWLYYVRAKWIKSQEWVLLEIKLPKDVLKSPQAMEVVLGSLHIPVDAPNLIAKWLKGEQRIWFSFEIVSLGGQIKFFLRASKPLKNRVEAAIYSQYPNVEIKEVPDYTNDVPYGLPGSDWELWGTELKFDKEDAYPIKTYTDYGTDQGKMDDPGKIDPMTPMLEFFGTLQSEEQIWVQILALATRKRFKKKGAWFEKQDWLGEAQATLDKLRKTEQQKEGKPVFLSWGETEALKAIERSMTKLAFDCGIRALYLGPKDKFNKVNIGGLIGSFTQYNSPALNAFKPNGDYTTGVKYPWQDLRGRRVARKKAVIFDAYRRRSHFYPPYPRPSFVLTTEELATLFHFPGVAAATPTLAKIESKRAEAPINLPGA